MCADPTPFDWMSDVVVPIMLGFFTLGIAIWAAILARQANRLNERTLEAAARERRAPYAAALSHRTGAMVASRQAGRDPLRDHFSNSLEELQAVDALRIRSDEPTARLITSRASITARHSEASTVDDYLDLSARLSEMIELWVVDPKAARDLIEADEWFVRTREAGGGPA